MCALTVFGERPSTSAISRVCVPLGNVARHLELAGGQRAPRFVGDAAAAGRACQLLHPFTQGRAVEPFGGRPHGIQDRDGVHVAVAADQAGGEIQAGPAGLPDAADGIPSRSLPPRGWSARTRLTPAARRIRPSIVGQRVSRTFPISQVCVHALCPSLSQFRTAQGLVRAHPRDRERHDVCALHAGRGHRERRLAMGGGRLRSPARSAVSADPTAAASRDPPRQWPGRSRATPRARSAPFHIAPPEANVTERVTGAQGSAPAPTLDDLDLGDRGSPRPIYPLPRRRAPMSQPSRDGSTTAGSRPRSAGPSRRQISARLVVHHAHRECRRPPIGRHAGALEPRFPGLSSNVHHAFDPLAGPAAGRRRSRRHEVHDRPVSVSPDASRCARPSAIGGIGIVQASNVEEEHALHRPDIGQSQRAIRRVVQSVELGLGQLEVALPFGPRLDVATEHARRGRSAGPLHRQVARPPDSDCARPHLRRCRLATSSTAPAASPYAAYRSPSSSADSPSGCWRPPGRTARMLRAGWRPRSPREHLRPPLRMHGTSTRHARNGQTRGLRSHRSGAGRTPLPARAGAGAVLPERSGTGVPQELVAEVVVALVHGLERIQEGARHELVEGCVEIFDRAIHHAGQDLRREAAAHHGPGQRDGLGLVRQARRAGPGSRPRSCPGPRHYGSRGRRTAPRRRARRGAPRRTAGCRRCARRPR